MIFTDEIITKEHAAQLYNEYSEFVYKVALFIIQSKSMAEDIMQETFIKVFKKYGQYDSSKPLGPWIYRITVNTARNMHRKQKWLGFIGSMPERESTEYVETIFLKEQVKKELWEEINKLSRKSREIVVLHFYLGMKLKEVSVTLGIPVGTCKSRLNSALTALRRQFNEELQSEIGGGEYNGVI